MKCLTLKNPWAAMVIVGVKPIENRSWKTNHRGPLLIHSAARPENISFDPPIKMSQAQAKAIVHTEHGHVVGVVELIDIYDMQDPKQRKKLYDIIGDEAFTEFVGDAFCWLFSNPKPLKEPIPYKGQLSIYNVPDELVKEVLP